jgi:hypothetical protein
MAYIWARFYNQFLRHLLCCWPLSLLITYKVSMIIFFFAKIGAPNAFNLQTS